MDKKTCEHAHTLRCVTCKYAEQIAKEGYVRVVCKKPKLRLVKALQKIDKLKGTPDEIMKKMPILDSETIEILKNCDLTTNVVAETPECCGTPVEIYPWWNSDGSHDWVAFCLNCWTSITPQSSREAAIEAWERKCK